MSKYLSRGKANASGYEKRLETSRARENFCVLDESLADVDLKIFVKVLDKEMYLIE